MIKEIMEWIKAIVFSLVIVGIITLFARPSLVIGPSMENTLQSGDLLLMEKMSLINKLPERGDIVVFKSELDLNRFMKKNLIKRVVGLPGDHVRIENGIVYVNETKLDENYIKDDFTQGNFEGIVPEEHVFLMGDNRINSRDSRDPAVGFVNVKTIKGKAYVRIFPFDRLDTFNSN